MSPKANNALARLQKLKEGIASDQSAISNLEGQESVLMADLKASGANTLEEAEDLLEQIQGEIDGLDVDINEGLEKAEGTINV